MRSRVHVLVPFWGLAGGVIKILDYAVHAANVGYPVTLWSSGSPTDDPNVATLPVVEQLLGDQSVELKPFDSIRQQDIHPNDVVLFTEPTHMAIIDQLEVAPTQLIHLVQGTRHANPSWNRGRNYRLLHRPMTRIAVSDAVARAVAPHVSNELEMHVIPNGHDVEYFANPSRPAASPTPLRVLYTTWKSDLGDRVAALGKDLPLAWIAIRQPLGWPALRNRYHGADVFLASPGPEEGFYLPGLEAQAAGCALVTSTNGGIASYCDPGINMVGATYDDPLSHLNRLIELHEDRALLRTISEAGVISARSRTLAEERLNFARLLEERVSTTIA